MRYAGEWKFAGGSRNAGESTLACAKREFEEEMLRSRAARDACVLA